MTTRQDHIIGTSGAELNLRAEPGDSVKWRETTLSLDTDHKALLYRYVSSDNERVLHQDAGDRGDRRRLSDAEGGNSRAAPMNW
ncbi:hypothetical protein SHIRM173S_08062 [Streptomyces hirsutus]